MRMAVRFFKRCGPEKATVADVEIHQVPDKGEYITIGRETYVVIDRRWFMGQSGEQLVGREWAVPMYLRATVEVMPVDEGEP